MKKIIINKKKVKKGAAVLMICASLMLSSCGSSSSDIDTSKSSKDNVITNKDTLTVDENATTVSELRISQDIIDNMAPATDTGELNITDEIIETGILNSGDTSRLESCMEKASRGEELTIAYLGGSITDGSNASPQETSCYAYLSTQWWKDTFPNANIRYINAGIGDTDSWIGVHRAKEDVLKYSPDLVIVEYSVNDWQQLNKETYDSLLRMLLTSDSSPAVISLMLSHETGGYAKEHAPIAFKYKVPMISYSALLTKGLVKWNDVGAADKVHPKNSGHALIARLLTEFYRSVLSDINSHPYTEYVVPDISLSQTKCRYDNSRILYSDELSATDSQDFEAGEVWTLLSNNNGWHTENAGNIQFTLNAKELGILYIQTNTEPEKYDICYEIYVDDVFSGTISGYDKDTWGQHVKYESILLEDTAAEHVISLVPKDGFPGKDFTITGIGVTE